MMHQQTKLNNHFNTYLKEKKNMKNDIRAIRLKNQYQEVIQAMIDEDQERVDPCIKAIIVNKINGTEDYTKWDVIFTGKKNTIIEGGNYKLRAIMGEKFPHDPPQVVCMDGFRHLHVFAGGKVCFKLLNKDSWKIGFTVLMLMNGIIKMLHSDPNIYDPASLQLSEMISKANPHKPNLIQYNHFMKEQAKKFSNRYKKEYIEFREEYGLSITEKELESDKNSKQIKKQGNQLLEIVGKGEEVKKNQ